MTQVIIFSDDGMKDFWWQSVYGRCNRGMRFIDCPLVVILSVMPWSEVGNSQVKKNCCKRCKPWKCKTVIYCILSWQWQVVTAYYPRDTMLARYYSCRSVSVSVCLSVSHEPVLYWNGWMDWADFLAWKLPYTHHILHCVARKFGYFQNRAILSKTQYSRFRKRRHGMSIVATCYQVSSTLVDTQREWEVEPSSVELEELVWLEENMSTTANSLN